MDLLECVTCEQRFILADAGDGAAWPCPTCHNELWLVVRSIPGAAHQIAVALNARYLSPGSGAEPKFADRGHERARRRQERQAESRTSGYRSELAERKPRAQ